MIYENKNQCDVGILSKTYKNCTTGKNIKEANINFLASLSSHVTYSLYAYKKKASDVAVPMINVAVPVIPITHGKSVNGIKIKE